MIHPKLLANYYTLISDLKTLELQIQTLEVKLIEDFKTTLDLLQLKYTKRKELAIKKDKLEEHIFSQLFSPLALVKSISFERLLAVTTGKVEFEDLDGAHGFVGRSAKHNHDLYDRTHSRPGFYLHSTTPGGGLVYSKTLTSLSKSLALIFSQYYKKTGLKEGSVIVAPTTRVTRASKLGSFNFSRASLIIETQLLQKYWLKLTRVNNVFHLVLIATAPITKTLVSTPTLTSKTEIITLELTLREPDHNVSLAHVIRSLKKIKNVSHLTTYLSPHYFVSALKFFEP